MDQETEIQQMPQPEPWLRGTHPHPHPILRAVLHSFEQVREDLALHTAGLTDAQTWRAHGAVAPLGYQLRHIAGSVDRLTTYAAGEALTELQLAEGSLEAVPGASLRELLERVEAALAQSGDRLRALDLSDLDAPRMVGRQRLPTNLGGLLLHLAEHTQRHLGEAIITAKLARA
jgi:hypothetical protein